MNLKEVNLHDSQILKVVEDLGIIRYSIGEGKREIEIERKKIEFKTNCGIRTIEFKKVELFKSDIDIK
ncbi:hypothetical protein [Plebeiibacterium marinum]|uniref:Uncharacterized protein n=1 Tax=Plebeiibacterium marinum TaxID=2992111 RepID=A0AAE3SMZ3_9BACT|nr:hypothetical protein [Plebeiobacterium marinum]MCW3808060.1 hypothetical protein [Plebeiobacterium marinum]